LKDPGQTTSEELQQQYQQTVTMLENLLKYRYNQATMKLLMVICFN